MKRKLIPWSKLGLSSELWQIKRKNNWKILLLHITRLIITSVYLHCSAHYKLCITQRNQKYSKRVSNFKIRVTKNIHNEKLFSYGKWTVHSKLQQWWGSLLSLCVWLLKVSGALGETQLRPEGLVETQRANSLIGTLIDRVSMLIQTIFFFKLIQLFMLCQAWFFYIIERITKQSFVLR